MTVEKYVNSITKKVKCSNDKRRKIRRQLSSEILAALEKGETLEKVMERMGNAKEVANELNLNLPEEEKKAYTKTTRIKIVSTALVLLVLIAYTIHWMIPKDSEIDGSGTFVADIVEDQVKQVIASLNDNDLEALKEESTPALQEALTAEAIDEAREQIGKDWGEFQSYGKIYMSETRQMGAVYALAQMTVTYENVGVTYTIVFDKDMKLAGLYMK